MKTNPSIHFTQGSKHLKERLLKRSEHFVEEFKCLEKPDDAFGVRITAVPIEDEMWLDHPFRNGEIADEFNITLHGVQYKSKECERDIFYPSDLVHSNWRPILRAARTEPNDEPNEDVSYNNYREIHRDGLIEIGFVSCQSDVNPNLSGQILFADWPIVMFANVAISADHVRKQAEVPAAEYALEVEIRNIGNSLTFSDGSRVLGEFQSDSPKFPRYLLGPSDQIPELLSLFRRDIWNYFGKNVSDEENMLVILNWTS